MEKKEKYGDDLATIPSERRGSVTDAVFGQINEHGPNYRNVGWMGTIVLMLKTQIGLGVLSIPEVFDAIGMVPGVICLLAIAAITTWSDCVIGVFKLRHPEVYGIDDVGGLICGRFGYILMGTLFCLYWIFVAAAGMLGISIALNALSLHGTCTVVFVVVAALIGFLGSSIQTLGRISWIAWVGVVGILAAIFTLTVAVGVQDRPTAAPVTPGPWRSDYKITNNTSPANALSALSTLVFAYAGTPAFFSIVSEMREPKHYIRSVMICQTIVTVTYLVIGIVVYYYCGSYVASPALGSAGPLLKRICYGFALPGLCASTILLSHVPAKYIFVRLLRGTRHLSSNTPVHWMVWFACTFSIAAIAYVIASGIPVFGPLVSLVGALFGTFLSVHPGAFMWLYDNWRRERSARNWKWTVMACWSIFVIAIGTFLMVGGTYGSVLAVVDAAKSSPWSCADNSNST